MIDRQIPVSVLQKLRAICMALPRVREEQAWVGIRWTIRRKNFAHVLMIVDGHPAAYAKAADSDGPLCILTFRSELAAFDPAVFKTGKYFKPVWFRNIAGMRIDDDTNWDAVKDHIEASYRQLSGSKQEST